MGVNAVLQMIQILIAYFAVIVNCLASTNLPSASPIEITKTIKWVGFTDPAGLYSLQYPKAWQVEQLADVVSIIAIKSAGAVTVSAYHIKGLSEGFTRQWLEDTFDDRPPTAELQSVSGNGWQGYRREYRFEDGGEIRDWIAVTAQSGSTYVLITANDTVIQMRKLHDVYMQILDSLKLYEIKTSQEDYVVPN